MKTQQPLPPQQLFSVAHFLDFGARYSIDYHFPGLGITPAANSARTVMRGYVDELTLPSGILATCSDLQVIEPWHSTSLGCAPLYILVVLEGNVQLNLNGKAWRVQAGMALATHLGEQQVLRACHQSDERLVTVSLALPAAGAAVHPAVAAHVSAWQQLGPLTTAWPVASYVLGGLRQALLHTTTPLARQLTLEGALLQLLGQQMHENATNNANLRGERLRLEQVRMILETAPEQPHTLEALARTAAMSTASLRSKFRQAYGDSVFNYLRDCRLALARRYLLEGDSVQEAAWKAGYAHATNFATAFRRRYGIAPSDVHPVQ
ncbi:helix-turn-helix transcriptional regulator [Mangrovibacter plantisponsor]|uniref:AraC-like DNA-binding protein n=1 Tax=Mangrovibacter plantisponsor TaxID=451513 RepID=A0A317Q6C2_9ENTR|nr:AraC family transcriptional regulator [Mangrovibacter plantisponsor]PWW11727.1 AraC-like DNA-binding protein [Mangrovibacter plantisponsor]